MQFLSILFLLNESLNNFARILLELKASDPTLKIEQFEDFRHRIFVLCVWFKVFHSHLYKKQL